MDPRRTLVLGAMVLYLSLSRTCAAKPPFAARCLVSQSPAHCKWDVPHRYGGKAEPNKLSRMSKSHEKSWNKAVTNANPIAPLPVEVWKGGRQQTLHWENGIAFTTGDEPLCNKGFVQIQQFAYNTDHSSDKSIPCLTTEEAASDSGRTERTDNAQTLKDQADAASATIPQRYFDAFNRAGYKVTLTNSIASLMPDIQNEQVRGYEHAATWDSVYGLFNRSNKTIVMARCAYQLHNGHRVVISLNDNERRTGIFRHEFGHAIDQLLGNFSHTKYFNDEYKKGKNRLSDKDRIELSYYLQSGNSGPEETFAELFSCIDGTGCNIEQDEKLKVAFPSLVAAIKRALREVR